MAPFADAPPPANVHALHDQAGWTGYDVVAGDNLSTIARRHGTTAAALQQHNHLDDPDRLLVGQHLQVPGTRTRPAAAGTPATRPGGTYTVRRGDTLSGIAARHETSVGAILRVNRIGDPHVIQAGQVITLPGPNRPASAPTPTAVPTAPAKAASPTTAPPKATGTGLTVADRTFLGRTYPADVVEQAAATRQYLATRPVPSRTQTRQLLTATAERHGLSPALALAIAWQESGWNQRAVSVCNARGVMQIMPAAADFASGLAGRDLDVLDAADNITAGVLILKYNLAHTDSVDQAIGAYYQGLHGVRTHGMYADTKDYVRSVTSHMSRF